MLENLRTGLRHHLSAAMAPTGWAGSIGLAVAVGLAYFLAARISLALLTKPEGVAVFWPAAGVAAGVLIALGPRARWPVAAGAMAATIVANLLGDRNLWSTILFALCNAGEAVLTAWLVEHYFGSSFNLGRLRNVLGLMAAAIAGTAVSGVGGSISFKLFHSSTTSMLTTWEHWFASDGLGIITVTPLLVELAAVSRERLSRSELVEGILAVAALTLTSGIAMFLSPQLLATVIPIALLFPPLLWLAARCRPVFAAAAAFIVSLMIVWTTTFGIGYLGNANVPVSERILAAQGGILLVTLVALVLAALFAELRAKGHQLEIASQHKSQFLANMSHELRTPLNAIIGYSEILQEEVKDLRQDQLAPDLKKIETAGRHLLSLINDILDLSKIEAGRMDVFVEDMEIAPLLDEVRSIITPLAEQNGNVLAFRLSPGLRGIRTDRTKLKQSLLNVLSNANKFTRNGRVAVAVEPVDGTRPMVRFAISDTGIGIGEDQLGRLFEAFTQADASTTKKFGGSGLGLAITRHFCRLLGGDITVTSRLGVGSTFVISLPGALLAPGQIEPAEAQRPPADEDDAITVLVVDDDRAAFGLLAARLKGEGCRLVHAATGKEALQLARRVRPDAITLDVLMPHQDGWAVLAALKADDELCDIPVVMVTAVPDRRRGVALGAVDVLTKPVDRVHLTTLLNRLVRRDGAVLLVEDDADARSMIRQTVAKMGLAVAEAENGQAALRWLADNPAPAIILLDLMMPEMDGFEFLDTLKDRADGGDIPVIVITGMQITAAECNRLLGQVQKVVAKGVSINIDIAAAIGEVVRRRPARTVADADGSRSSVDVPR